jgi:hypothetical protein
MAIFIDVDGYTRNKKVITKLLVPSGPIEL